MNDFVSLFLTTTRLKCTPPWLWRYSNLVMAPIWWSADTIAVVTEGHTGTGLEIIKQLACRDFTPILTSNNDFKLQQTADFFNAQGICIIPRLLDITDPSSVQQFAAWLVKEFGGLHILIHNAAASESTSKAEISKNYYGRKQFVKAMIPLFRPLKQGSRIVVTSSASSPLDQLQEKIPSEWVDKLCQLSNLSEEIIDSCIENYGEWPALPEDADDPENYGEDPELFRDYADYADDPKLFRDYADYADDPELFRNYADYAFIAYATLLGKDLSNWSLDMEKKIYVKFLCPGNSCPQEFVGDTLRLALE